MVTRSRIETVSDLPSWYPNAAEAKPAPMPLLRVQAFLNTRDVEEGTDLLADPETANPWLIDARLIDPTVWPGADELEFAREVREDIRRLIASDVENGLGALRSLADAHRARLTVAQDGALALTNGADEDLGDRLFGLLLIVYRAQQDGTRSRLKVCANPECQWAFFDRSRNQQGSWCDMAVCGNRLKNRHLRARRR
jgi:predicted RNA-binding Zn ribbon-like protein